MAQEYKVIKGPRPQVKQEEGTVDSVDQMIDATNPEAVLRASQSYDAAANLIDAVVYGMKMHATDLSHAWSSDTSVQLQQSLQKLHASGRELSAKLRAMSSTLDQYNQDLNYARSHKVKRSPGWLSWGNSIDILPWDAGKDHPEAEGWHGLGSAASLTDSVDSRARQTLTNLNSKMADLYDKHPERIEYDYPNVNPTASPGLPTPQTPPPMPDLGNPSYPNSPYDPGSGPSGTVPTGYDPTSGANGTNGLGTGGNGTGDPGQNGTGDPGQGNLGQGGTGTGAGTGGDGNTSLDPSQVPGAGDPNGTNPDLTNPSGTDLAGVDPSKLGTTTPDLNTPNLNTPNLNTPGLNTPGLNTPTTGIGNPAGVGGVGSGTPQGTTTGSSFGAGGAGGSGSRSGLAANGTNGMGGMPFMPMGGGMGNEGNNDRERTTWLVEDENVWGGDATVAPPVIT
jgi:uncharacterized protein YukE